MTKELNMYTKWYKNPKIIGSIVLTIVCLGVIGSCSNKNENQQGKQNIRSAKVVKKKHKKIKKKLNNEPSKQKQQDKVNEEQKRWQEINQQKANEVKQRELVVAKKNGAKLFASFTEQDLYNKGFEHIKKGLDGNPVFVNNFTTNSGIKFKLVRVDYEVPPLFGDLGHDPVIAVYDYDKTGKYSLCGNLLYHCQWQEKIVEQKKEDARKKQQEKIKEKQDEERQKRENYNPENIKAQAQGFGQSTDSRLNAVNIKGYEGANNTIVYERHMYNAPVLFRVDYPNGITKVYLDHINGKLEYVGHTPVEVKRHGYF